VTTIGGIVTVAEADRLDGHVSPPPGGAHTAVIVDVAVFAGATAGAV